VSTPKLDIEGKLTLSSFYYIKGELPLKSFYSAFDRFRFPFGVEPSAKEAILPRFYACGPTSSSGSEGNGE
jgi:hypothetical protein